MYRTVCSSLYQARLAANRSVINLSIPKNYKSTLVLIEHKNGKLSSSSFNAVTAASQFGFPVTALIASSPSTAAAIATQTAAIAGVSKVVVAKSDVYAHDLAEMIAPLVVETTKAGGFTHIIAAHTAFGKNVLPRAAAVCDASPISDVIQIEGVDTFKRPIYAGNAIAQVKSKDPVKFITIRTTAFPAAAASGGSAVSEDSTVAAAQPLAQWVSEEVAKSDRPELASAKIVIGGGRGMKSGENFKMLYDLADKLGGTVGASRAAVDAGFVGNDLQIGQTGKIIAPELYIAVGISGAIQHLAGMKDSKTIVAINKDPEAPIFQVSDYGLVADLFKAIPELTEKISK
ncbi:hypothetical protein BATDEDRAFT_18359 [Batrachochytrium dendrobatidis JAM81]|uniref:Probable electron transfer flavoprotein subunit alpha n=2 Tax=Batrachochytrium dendrobatidis TaxID=109871 RepID=F4NUM1_BATDJ|nr:uncharacterized protein BATDEDRAFT_18359 [Batrachochytrium dendrobatidis JAM81]EGF83197.1 hypothetical protein BATDEDRAFT_18359 [Batrachochytrium dendrobatidis JAM81]KAJ8325700.1 Electron transfer flavoprotein alpha-subunit [Batrachochytrium dendrobatidis]KAK5671585.1 Electron transfer flavoprotein alpha-subunit [Batrachochytrium dendrobatidis]OAJ36423.1 hypothetical protein BDEG_20598 [Batrachochytrium dendrobatidis JEL423]|eukprot:XP_006675169.1 hypothetical protein BATDEDRAFT_18359 [Batrachochytrium dendrobatidis JAM81]